MMNVDASTRFVGSIVLNNPGQSAIYVHSSAEQVAIVDGTRRRTAIPDGALRVSPEEFVLRPGDAFTARLVADPGRIEGDAASYYVKFVDTADVHAERSGDGRMQSAYLLGFEALVTVNKTPVPRIDASRLRLDRGERGDGYALKNLSGHHLYLDRGGVCPPGRPMLVDCRALPDFPRQSWLPNETVQFAAPAIQPGPGDLIGLLVLGGLDPRDRADVVYLPVPPASAAATSSLPAVP
jgi:hypothetical protein